MRRAVDLSEARAAERLVEILDEIVGILEADIKAQHALADAHLLARLGTHVGVGGAGWMAGERLGIADVVRDVDQLQPALARRRGPG